MITSDDNSYEWLENWVAQHRDLRKTKNLTVSTRHEERALSDEGSTIMFVPGFGEHFFRYKGSYCWLSRDREKLQHGGGGGRSGGSASLYYQTMTLRMFRGSKTLMSELLHEARHQWEHRFNDRTKVYVGSDYWELVSARKIRTADSLVFADGIFDRLLDDMRRFMATRDWYEQRGIPYRRGYLLYGEPGNGKSSLVSTLAAAMGKDVAVLSLSDGSMNDSALQRMLRDIPRNAILCLEDIDAAFAGRENQADNRLTFTGLLNALDGLASREDRVIFMTTNRKEMLAGALVRPGRADVHMYIGNANESQAKLFYLRFFPNELVKAEAFSKVAGTGQFSMASLQEHLVRYRDDATMAATAPSLEHTEELTDV